jgi:hypothetical protein
MLLDEIPTLDELLDRSDLYKRLMTTLPQLEIDDRTYFVFECDLLLDLDDLALHVVHREAPELLPTYDDGRRKLVGDEKDGQLVRWKEGTVLSYCVARETFESEEHYRSIVEYMAIAARDWENTCDVAFEYMADLDAPGGTRKTAMFEVVSNPFMHDMLALAFFPYQWPSKRKIYIGAQYHGDHKYDRTGILRHELGHVLGFRHEHIRPEAPPLFAVESRVGTQNLTEYDQLSVMHYPYWNHPVHGNVGNLALTISPRDLVGAQKLYGPPKSKAAVT